MLYLTCTMISSIDLAHYGVSHANDWVFVVQLNNRSGLKSKSNLLIRKKNRTTDVFYLERSHDQLVKV